MLVALISVVSGVSPDVPARRDPFMPQLSPVRAVSCRTNLACMRVADVHLFGTVVTPRGPLAILGSAGLTFLARPGDLLMDGELRSVSAGRAVLRRFEIPEAPGSEDFSVPHHVDEVREVSARR